MTYLSGEYIKVSHQRFPNLNSFQIAEHYRYDQSVVSSATGVDKRGDKAAADK